MTTYFVSSEIGSNNNAGTSATAPLASLQAAEALVKPGDTVEVMNGTYTGNAPGGGDVLDITTSGTASAPITFEAAPGQTPVINSSGGWNAINIEGASYIVISGFTVVGDAANYTLAQALAGYGSGNANLDGNGIAVTSPGNGVDSNHITLENNTVYDEPGAGIYTQGTDYLQVLNNVVYDNAYWSAYGTSGISIGISANSNTNAGVHDIISGNLVYGNANLVPTTGGNTITDGEGIILDTNPGFVGEILVENNTVYGNGSSGIESFLTNNAVITNNTVYGNDTGNVQAASNAEIFINQSNNDTVTGNTTTAPNLTPPAAPVISGDTVGFDDTVTLNGTAEAGSTVTVFDKSTQLGTAVTNASGAWMFTTGALANGSQSFTATATDSVGNVSPLSSALVMTLNAPVNLVANGNFATGDFTDWTLGGNYNAGQITIDPNAEGGSAYAAGLGSMGADGTLSQTIATTAGQTYTLSFWLQNEESGTNDFKAIWNGQTLLSLTNAAQSGYTEYTYSVTATSSQTTLEFSAANGPSQWDLDNISLTANGTTSSSPPPPPAAPVISTGVANSSETVTLTGTATAGSTVTVSDGGATALGTTTATGGSWSFTTAAALAAGSYAFTATDTTSAGTSAASSPFDVTVTSSSPPPPPTPPVISTGVANSNETVTLTGTATAGSTVTVSDGGATALGTATATGGSWSFTTAAALAAGSYAFTATDTTSAGTSAASSPFDVTVTSPSPPPSAPTVSSIAESPASGDLSVGNTIALTLNMSGNVTVNTAKGKPTLALNDGGTATYKSGSGTSALIFTYTVAAGQNTAALAATKVNLNGATITAATTGSGASSTNGNTNGSTAVNLSLTGLTQTGPQIDTTAPPAPTVTGDTVNSNNSVTLSGSAAANDTVTVYNGKTDVGTIAANASGLWSYTTGALASGSYIFTATATDSAGNTSTSSNAIDPNIGSVIRTDGSTSLTVVGNEYFLDGPAGTGPALQYQGAPVVVGQSLGGSYVPIGAVQTADGYDVAFELTGANQFTIWNVNSSGQFVSFVGPFSGTSYTLESYESVFNQDLNGDGVIGPTKMVLHTDTNSFGSTNLTVVGNEYFLDGPGGTGPALQYQGAPVVVGQSLGGSYVPIGAVQTATGYDVAFELTGASQFTIWNVNSSGQFVSFVGPFSGTSYTLESYESVFNQDLNGDGVIGPTKMVLQTDTNSFGSTSLTVVGNEYFLDGPGGTGPALQYGGAPVVVGQSLGGSYVPIGAVQTATGYDVAFELTGASQFTIWNVNSSGQFVSFVGPFSGTSNALQSYESVFNQDLNGYAAPGTLLEIKTPTTGAAGAATIGAGATLEIAAADSGPVTFAASTGMLKLDTPSTFSGEISNFTGNGTLSGSDQIDLTNINPNSVKDSYANGVLTVTDGTNTDNLTLNGSYTLANFSFASDGSGGTIVYDPPAPTSSGQNASAPNATSTGTSGPKTIGTGATLGLDAADHGPVAFTGSSGTLILAGSASAGNALDFTGPVSGFGGQNVIDLPEIAFDAHTTLGYLPNSNQAGGTLSVEDGTHGATITLLGNYMASCFATESDNHGGTVVVGEASQPADQSLLSNPHHT